MAVADDTVDKDRSFDIQLFHYALSPGSFLTIDTAEVPVHKQFGLSLVTGYQRNPFSLYETDRNDNLTNPTEVVRNQFDVEITGAIGLLDRFQIGFAVPFTLSLDGERFNDAGRATESRSSSGIGDVRLEGKARLAAVGPDEEIVFSVAPGLTIPTGNQNEFLGEKNLTGRLRGLGELRRGDLRIGAMLGVLVRQESKIFGAAVGSQLLYGVAASYQFHPQLAALVEVSGRSGLADFADRYVDSNPVEADGALRISLTSMLTLTVGGGGGIVKGIGSPMGRGFLALSWFPDFRDRDQDGVYDINDKCPDQLEDRDGYKDDDGCPDPDNDGDGITDATDKCPNEAEDFDQFEDEDGCSDLDNDHDGIPDIQDACPNVPEDGQGKRPNDGCPSSEEDTDGDVVPDVRDKCPDEPEDRDDFEDDDGCPDPDNDNDGIPDNFDACPNEPEDSDGFEDDDGCPDLDNDKDGIPDAADKCPNQPETLNGFKDEDGCPDSGAPVVRMENGRIAVDERIGFVSRAGKVEVKEASLPIVNMVALVLKGYTEIVKLRIEVYAEGVTKEETRARANALRDALVGKGIEAARLSAMGMGGGAARIDFLVEATAPIKHRSQPGAVEPAANE